MKTFIRHTDTQHQVLATDESGAEQTFVCSRAQYARELAAALANCDFIETTSPAPEFEELATDRSNAYRPSESEIERSERQGDLIAMHRAEY